MNTARHVDRSNSHADEASSTARLCVSGSPGGVAGWGGRRQDRCVGEPTGGWVRWVVSPVEDGSLGDTSAVTDSDDPPVAGPVWRVPAHPLPPELARRSGQVLARAEVATPAGTRYWVQVRPETPTEFTPLPYLADAGADIVPAVVGAAAGALASRLSLAYRAPARGWVVEVLRRETRWRAEKVVHTETLPTPDAVIDRALELVELIQRGIGRAGWCQCLVTSTSACRTHVETPELE